jgi:ankyrin repeat protein
MHGAAMKGFNFIVEFLAANGAELEVKDANGTTPIDLAMGRYNEDFLRQAAEPHTETAKLLESLIAAKATLGSAVSRASTP